MKIDAICSLRRASDYLLGLFVGVWISFVAGASGQALEETLFTTGTTIQSSVDNQHWAYLAFQIDDPMKLRTRRLAVFAKQGQPDSLSVYTPRGVVAVQTDVTVLKLLIGRAAHLGESAQALEMAIDELFAGLVPDPSLSLPQKLSGVIQGTLGDPAQYRSLVLLSRKHPALALALGLAHAQPIPGGATTFEVRELDATSGGDLGVMGRVTVTAGSPVILPRPGRAVHVPDSSVMGHLNARLRWGTPLDLRREALLHFGYNLYRVPQAYAEAQGMDVTPPTAATLRALLLQPQLGVVRVNNVPILSARVMSEVEAADLLTDPTTAFLSDDNGLSREDAHPFLDGEAFYYFVAARDLLGRDGLLSQGTLVVMTDRVPPDAPRGVVVENDYRYENDTPIQRLRVTWKQRPADPENMVVGYYVHRWNSPGEVATLGGNPLLNRVSTLIPHVPGQANQTFLDETPGAPPTDPNDFDHTIYYTVRAVEMNALGTENLSANSAPASGVLRDREAPEGPTGGPLVECCEPTVEATTSEIVPLVDGDAAEAVFRLICSRETPSIVFADFFVGGTGATQHWARMHFRPGQMSVNKRLVLRRNHTDTPLQIFCRVGLDTGVLSDFSGHPVNRLPEAGQQQLLRFAGSLNCTEVRWLPGIDETLCPGHDPHPFGQGGDGFPGNGVHGIKLQLDLKESTREWRLYRRIDGGKLTLLRQGRDDFQDVQQIEIVDTDLPSSSATIAYFGQLFDQNGNASQLALLGKAVPLRQAPPAPMLAPVKIGGLPGNPTATVRWFCPPQGVERFVVYVHVDSGAVPETLSPQLGDNHHSPIDQFQILPNESESETLTYGAYYTPQVGSSFGAGPEFQFSFPMDKGKTYHIQIAAVAANGGKRNIGNHQVLKWQGAKGLTGVPVPGTPNVPWPEILPPTEDGQWHSQMQAEQLSLPDFSGVGVRIGELTNDEVIIVGGQIRVAGEGTLKSALYPAASPASSGDALLPLVLYRYQLANAIFPNVSHQLIQVTPLMEKIAVASKNDGGVESLALRDPFVRIVTDSSLVEPPEIFLIDTQPVVKRARYAYVAVRFARDGEIASVHPISSLQIQ